MTSQFVFFQFGKTDFFGQKRNTTLAKFLLIPSKIVWVFCGTWKKKHFVSLGFWWSSAANSHQLGEPCRSSLLPDLVLGSTLGNESPRITPQAGVVFWNGKYGAPMGFCVEFGSLTNVETHTTCEKNWRIWQYLSVFCCFGFCVSQVGRYIN